MPAEPQDEGGLGSSYADLVDETDVPRVGDEEEAAPAAASASKSSSSHAKASKESE